MIGSMYLLVAVMIWLVVCTVVLSVVERNERAADWVRSTNCCILWTAFFLSIFWVIMERLL